MFLLLDQVFSISLIITYYLNYCIGRNNWDSTSRVLGPIHNVILYGGSGYREVEYAGWWLECFITSTFPYDHSCNVDIF